MKQDEIMIVQNLAHSVFPGQEFWMMMHSFSLVLYHGNRIVNDIRLHANANYNVRCAAAEKSKFIWKDQKTVAVGITPSLLQTILMGSGMFEKRFLHSPDSYWAFRRVCVWVERPEIWGLLAPFIMLSPKHEEVQDVFRKRRRGRKCDWDALHTLPGAGLHCWLHTDLYLMLKVRNMGWLTCFSILYSLVGSESRVSSYWE